VLPAPASAACLEAGGIMIGFATKGYATASAIRRIATDRTSWRVKVETWPGREGWAGRFVFEPEHSVSETVREGPAVLRAASREELVRGAHELSDERLRALCRSLG
jgi:hypothetical protein